MIFSSGSTIVTALDETEERIIVMIRSISTYDTYLLTSNTHNEQQDLLMLSLKLKHITSAPQDIITTTKILTLPIDVHAI